MRNLLLWAHIITAGSALLLVSAAFMRRLIFHATPHTLRRPSLITFGVGVGSGAVLLITTPSIIKSCVMMTVYVTLFMIAYAYTWRRAEAPQAAPAPAVSETSDHSLSKSS
jgi:hypothetical protein